MGPEILAGALMAALGVVLLIICVAYSRDEEWRLHAAETRRLEHWLSPAIRRGEMTVQEWNKRFADKQRRTVRRYFVPALLIWIAIGLFLLGQGLAST